MSDKLLERIAAALEAIASKKTPVPDAPTKAAAPVKAEAPAPKAAAPPAKAAAPAKPSKPSKPSPGEQKGPGGSHTQDEVRAVVRQVAAHKDQGKQAALDILDQEAGVQNVSALKPEDYDKVYEACKVALGEGGEGEDETAGEFDPTA